MYMNSRESYDHYVFIALERPTTYKYIQIVNLKNHFYN